jgi:hypothetical protein
MKSSQRTASMLPAVAILLVGTTPCMQGQAEPGTRIRVATNMPSHKRFVGSLISADADSVRLTSSKDGRVVAVANASIVRLEKSGGRHSNPGGGALIGGLIGGGLGLALGVLASTEDSGWYEVGGAEIAAGSAVLGLAGAGLGALMGAASHKEKWEPLPSPAAASTVYLQADSVTKDADALPTVR